METPNKSEEELELEKAKAEAEVSAKSETSEEEEKATVTTEAETEDEEQSTVPLADFTRTKEILWRMTKEIVEDPDRLAELAESDPKRLERLKGEFPKLFKDVKIPTKTVTDEDIEARINAAVAKQLTSSGKADALGALQSELKMTDMEFLDIKDEIAQKADRLINIELASNYKEAVMLAYKNLNPKKYSEIVAKNAAKDIAERKKNSKGGSGLSTSGKKFSQNVMDNYQKLGFKTPQEMVDYQDPKRVISIVDSVRQ